MAWRNAQASMVLVAEINARWPRRDKSSDGTIGDAAHAARSSDHNPWLQKGGQGIVRARDVDKDGIDAPWLVEYLRQLGQRGDPRLRPGGYIIFNRRITTPDFSGWKVYTGTNPHDHHFHVSFSTDTSARGFDSTAPWGIANAPAQQAAPAAHVSTPSAPPKPKGIPKMIERRLTVGNNHGRIVCPAEARSRIASEVWVSVSGEGGCKGRVVFQVNSDTDGAPAGSGPAWDLALRNGNRAAKRIPATTEFLEYWVTVNGVQGSGEGSLLVEFVPR